MKPSLLLALIIACSAPALGAEAQPAASATVPVARYKAALQETLSSLHVTLREAAVRGTALQLTYDNANTEETGPFILAAVLRLAVPLAGNCRSVIARAYRGRQKLLEVTVAPEDLPTVCEADLDPAEQARVQQLAATTLEHAGLAQAPRVTISEGAKPAPIASSIDPLTGTATPVPNTAEAPTAAGSAPTAPADTKGAAVANSGEAGKDAGAPRDGGEAGKDTGAPKNGGEAGKGGGAVGNGGEAGKDAGAPRGGAEAVAAALAVTSVAPTPDDQTLASAVLAALTAARLENLEVGRLADGWFVGLENRTYRSDVTALAAALQVLAQALPPALVTLEAKRDDVPVLHTVVHLGEYAAAGGGLFSDEELVRRWPVVSGPAPHGESLCILARGNRSYGRTDVAVRPAVRYEIGNEADPFESDLWLLSRADTTVSDGLHLRAQMGSRLTSGVSSRIEQALLSHTTWLRHDLLATASVGKFEESLYGWYGEMQWDRQQHRLGLMGMIVGTNLSLGSRNAQDALAYYEYDWGALGLTTRVGYGRFVDNQRLGALLALRRRFGESEITAEAIRTEDDGEAVNFRLSVPLGPKVAAAPKSLRLRTDTAFKIGYHSNLSIQGSYLQDGQDLASFRGELSAPYVREHPERLLTSPLGTPASLPASPSVGTPASLPASRLPLWRSSLNLDGSTGLLRIPTADVLPEGVLAGGISYLDKGHSRVASAQTDAMPLMVGIGLLPNLELVGKLTIFHDVKAFDWPYNMDRSFNAQYRLWQQRRLRPAVAVGAQDITFGTTTTYLGKSEYLVGTWQAERVRLHLGWGRRRLEGAFGGLEYDLLGGDRLHLMLDYDTRYVNAGLRGFFGDSLSIDVGMLGLGELTGAVVYRKQLQ